MSGFGLDDSEVLPEAPFSEGGDSQPEAPIGLDRLDLPRSDDDLLAAPSFATEEGPAPEEAEDEGDGGFSDGDGIVRVWLDGGRLIKCRVSPVWFSRLRQGDKLQHHFGEALMLAMLDRAAGLLDEPDPEPVGPMEALAALPDEVRAVFETLPPLSRELLSAIDAVAEELDQRIGVTLETRNSEQKEAVKFVGRSQGVTVIVDEWGNTTEVDFDEKWLDQAQVGAIVTHVQLAADRAQARLQAPAEDPTQPLMEEQQLLSIALTALLNPRSEK